MTVSDEPKSSKTSLISVKETKIFDPADGYGPTLNDPLEVTDASVTKRGSQWWMFLAGQVKDRPAIQLFSASLPEGKELRATGWKLTPDPMNPTKVLMLAEQELSKRWDLNGGRHCPSYVRGWDPHRNSWVERIYYAGAAENLWGPYTIGYLEWNGDKWVEQAEPVFAANQDWERGSVYEPNLIYFDGKWRMWYVAGSNAEDYMVQGYAESVDGRTNWSEHKIFFAAEEKVFDFCVARSGNGFEAVFSRVWLAGGKPPARTGLWWCRADRPDATLRNWSTPVQFMTAEDRGWHVGPWKPSLQFSETEPTRRLVFFDGLYRTDEPGPFPFAFTLGCAEFDVP